MFETTNKISEKKKYDTKLSERNIDRPTLKEKGSATKSSEYFFNLLKNITKVKIETTNKICVMNCQSYISRALTMTFPYVSQPFIAKQANRKYC